MDIYIKQNKKATVIEATVVLDHVCEWICEKDIGQLKIMQVNKASNNFCVVSSIEIIRAIKKVYPGANITTLGEESTLIILGITKENKAFVYLKIAFVTAILFTGCTTAIITFHVESSLSKVFDVYANILQLGSDPRQIFMFLEIPYAVGIALGIVVFFNHIFGKKITTDPTPLEVEMHTYDTEVIETLIEHKE